MHPKKNILLILLVFISMLFSVAAISAPSKVVYDIYGKPYSISLKPKKWIIITYWADWCRYCIAEVPELNRLAASIKTMPVIFFGVNYDNIPDKAQRQFAREHGVNYLLLSSNPFSNLVPDKAVSTLPTTFIISPSGEVKQLNGTQSARSILAALR